MVHTHTRTHTKTRTQHTHIHTHTTATTVLHIALYAYTHVHSGVTVHCVAVRPCVCVCVCVCRYGVGCVHFRKEQYETAYLHFERASEICSTSSVLRCYMGMALARQAQNLEAQNVEQANEKQVGVSFTALPHRHRQAHTQATQGAEYAECRTARAQTGVCRDEEQSVYEIAYIERAAADWRTDLCVCEREREWGVPVCVCVCVYVCVCAQGLYELALAHLQVRGSHTHTHTHTYRMLQNLARGPKKRNSLCLRELSRLAKSDLINHRELSRGPCSRGGRKAQCVCLHVRACS